MSETKRSNRYRNFINVMRAIGIASILILMTALYRQDEDAGSHYIHPRRAMQ